MCPKDEILSVFVDGEIGSPWNNRLEAHIKQCARCARKVKQYQEISSLFSDDTIPVKESMDRVKKKMDFTLSTRREYDFSEIKSGSQHLPFWRKHVMVPMPVLAAGFSVLMVLVASLFFFLGRNDTQVVRSGQDQEAPQNIHVYYQMDDPDLLRKILTSKEYSDEETIINLPQDNDFTIIGEPEVKRLIEIKGK